VFLNTRFTGERAQAARVLSAVLVTALILLTVADWRASTAAVVLLAAGAITMLALHNEPQRKPETAAIRHVTPSRISHS
jgi:hypothetical protein